jgi:hypothetical protein
LLRTHKYEEDVVVATRQVYPFSTAKQFRKIDSGKLKEELSSAKEKNAREQGNDTLKGFLTDKSGRH